MDNQNTLKKYLSPLGVWALSFGCSVGWGAFVMPGTTFLPIAGPLGTALGITIGAIIMLVIGRCYYYLMNRYPDSGGTYTYTKKILGYDHGFLSGWFLVLAYIVIVWANLTALALIGRSLLGDMFQFGFHYQLAGYDIYFGEILVALGVLAACGLLCAFCKRLSNRLQILMAAVLICGIIVCFVAAAVKNGGLLSVYQPAFSPLSESGVPMQIISIVALAPWAYVGFESVSHSAEEFRFKRNKTFIIIIISVFTAGLAYVLLSLLAVNAAPEGYADWSAYIADIGNLKGMQEMPTFYVVNNALGTVGVIILGITVLSGIITGIVGNTVAASRVLYSIAKDDIIPHWFAKTNKDGNPTNAILFITLVSAVIPFFGRTAISWIVDVTTVGGTIIYAYTSVAALKEAKACKNNRMIVCGAVGILFSLAFALYFLVPHISSVSTLGTESYLILSLWSILGMVFFRNVFRRDKKRRFGKSIVVWLVLLFLIMFTSIVWMQEENDKALNNVQNNITTRYSSHIDRFHPEQKKKDIAKVNSYVESQIEGLNVTILRNNLIRIIMIVFSVVILFLVYKLMFSRQREFDRVQDMAFKDAMTGVGNSHAYNQTERTIDVEIASGQIVEFAIVVCDLNGLKQINDTLGHNKGDEFIRQACGIICEIFAHSPVFRTGGDEFVAILRGRDYLNRAELIDKITESNNINAENGGAVIAAGLSEFNPSTDRSVDSVFVRADSAMYINKKALKNK